MICRTDLVARFELEYGDVLAHDGDRALVIRVSDVLPTAELQDCIATALTYHLGR